MNKVYAIRHGEKPKLANGKDDESDKGLSAEGYLRASGVLVSMFNPRGKYGGIDYLFAAAESKHSNRCVETLESVHNWLELKINDEFEEDEYKDLAKRLKSGKKYANASVLICWHHGSLPKLAMALGVAKKDLPWQEWPDDVFNVVWIISFGKDKKGKDVVTIRSEVQAP